MDLATILNPTQKQEQSYQPIDHQVIYHQQPFYSYQSNHQGLRSPPLSPRKIRHNVHSSNTIIHHMKPRSRFSALEDAIICQGVANGLTWGQISGQLPHRKRATCFNRYRTLQGIRKSRPHSPLYDPAYHQPTPSSSSWLPSTPPSSTCVPIMMKDNTTSSGFEIGLDRRYSSCSSVCTSPLPSPALLHQDYWHSYDYSRRASSSTTSSSSSFSSTSTFDQCPL
ncbi:uncharacterized protein BX664DRAFT_388107 [Halteromyces radiatus]|uniref:uncharacterized protein n=1 Tax=Halteromyces radiatus TaxID=101107 RepID=UPI002220ED0D|nr:uncharacterized protein BX664DRAFT_388107 [Halteromyces radiatus]KAI8082991.1 hypothetical protein BX664DRAFT_388107 [Halteromyces radiatus]